jgi:hypothetical protein
LSENVEKSGRLEGKGPKGYAFVRVDKALLKELAGLFPEVEGISDTAKVNVLLRKLLMMERDRRVQETDVRALVGYFKEIAEALDSARSLFDKLRKPETS